MSTKTLRKRIALVAVSALGAGLLSVVAVPSANAAANVAAGATQTAAVVEGVLNIATEASTTGNAVTTTTLASSVPTLLTSVGLVNVSDIAGGKVAGTTQTATLLSNGKLTVYTGFESNSKGALITVEGGTLACNVTGTSGNTQAINGSLTACSAFDGTASPDDTLVAVITPNSGATSMIVRLYNKASATSAADHVTSSSKGDLNGQINVTVAGSSTAGVLSTAKSGAYWVAAHDSAAVTADTGSTGATDYGRKLYLSVRIRDAYGSALAAGDLITVSATGGARVKINPSSASDAGTQASDYSVAAVDEEQVVVTNPTVNPMASTVTISVGGTVIATRTASFSGEVAKVVLSSPVIGQIGGTGTSGNIATYKLYDAANNPVYVDYSGSDNTTTPPQNLNEDTAVRGTVVSSVARDRDWSVNLTTGVVTSGRVIFTCGSSAGTGKISFIYTNTSGSIVKSNVLDAKCAGDAVSYTASYDKAKYAPGEIATLTLTFKDSKGNVANDIADVDSDGAAGEITISTAGMSQAINGPTTDGTDGASIDQGTLTYRYAVGTTEGTFTNRIDVPDVNEAGASILTAATSATLTVAANSTAVSNADVLKAIVSLIASINKQIAALQKALLRR